MTDETSGRGDAESRVPALDPKDLVIWEELAQRSWFGPRMRLCIQHKPTGIEVKQRDLRLTSYSARRVLMAELSEKVAARPALPNIEHNAPPMPSVKPAREAGAFVWQCAGDPTPRPRHYVAPKSIPFQARVQPWMLECFGQEISADKEERNHRFFEEATELVQACGMTVSEAHQLVDYVYGRRAGEKHQEIGGVMVTLAALCLAQGEDMHAAGETELARVWTKVEQIRAKQAAKPKHSPLPEHVHRIGHNIDVEGTAAIRTLQQAGYIYAGGQMWRPPLGKPPVWTIHETDASRDVLAERRRQVEEEGWTCARDDDYSSAELAQAAAAYALHAGGQKSAAIITWLQSWAMEWFKPTTARRNLVKAGALILAEIERLDRAAATAQSKEAR